MSKKTVRLYFQEGQVVAIDVYAIQKQDMEVNKVN